VRHGSIDLVLALCHEVENLLAGVRLEGELADRGAAQRVSGLAGRAGALLALVRPLLEPTGRGAALDPRELSGGVQRSLGEALGPRVELAPEPAAALPELAAEGDLLQALMLAAIGAAEADSPRADARLRLALEPAPGGVAFVLEGFSRSDAHASREQLAGATLVRALAEYLLEQRGGRAAVTERDGRPCLELVLPATSKD
jgi:hypothetical protein